MSDQKDLKEFDELIHLLATTYTQIDDHKMNRYRLLRKKFPYHHYRPPHMMRPQ